MPDFYFGEEATREYDPVLFKRIVSYVRPYKALLLLSLASLLISTAGELFIPILVRRVMDEAIFVSYRLVDPSVQIPQALSIDIPTLDGVRRFFSKKEMSHLSRSDQKRLEREGRMSLDEWYVFRYGPSEPSASVILAYPRFFELGLSETGGYAAIKVLDLKLLSPEDRRAVRDQDYRRIGSVTALFLLVLVAVLAATFAQSFAASLMGQRVMTDLRLKLFTHLSSQSLAFLSRHPVGRLVTRITSDVETINDFFTSVLISFLKDISIMIGVLVALFFLSPLLALVACCTLPPVFIATLVSRVKARDAFRKQRSAVSKVSSYLAERIAGIHVVQLFAREKSSAAGFALRNKELLEANLKEMHVFASFRPTIDFLSAVTTATVICFGAYLYLGGALSLGVLIAFVNLVSMFYSPVQDISEKYTMLQSAMAGAERIFGMLDANDVIPDHPKQSMLGPISGKIDFDSVRFAYKPGEDVLKDVTFSVAPGETVAIVGYTGAGKTTIANLITRFWDVQSGCIRIDGIPVRDLPLATLRSSVLAVLQDVFLFSGTVADNIRLGSGMTMDEVESAAAAVHAHQFISRLPKGYDTMLSEGATNISAGQRQLISFARVVAHDPRVVILDEATSAIDTETERLIQKGLDQVLRNRTAIVIAHRLSTIRHADRILVLSGGRLIEQGAHADLIAQNGMYAKLYRLQYEQLRS